MCGEIDEEITIPELVKEGSLCPHQDFVYFNYPTEEECQAVEKFEERSDAVFQKLMQDSVFVNAIQSHKALADLTAAEKLLGAKTLPVMDKSKMEPLLTGFLYEDTESYTCDEAYREALDEF